MFLSMAALLKKAGADKIPNPKKERKAQATNKACIKALALLLISLFVFLPVTPISGFQPSWMILLADAAEESPADSLSIGIDAELSNQELMVLHIEGTAPDIEIECVRWNVYSDTESLISCRGPDSCCEDFSLPSDAGGWQEPLQVTAGLGSENLVVLDLVYSYIWEEVTSGIVPTRRSHQKQAFIRPAEEEMAGYYELSPVASVISDTILPSPITIEPVLDEQADGLPEDTSTEQSEDQLEAPIEESALNEPQQEEAPLSSVVSDASGQEVRIPLKVGYKFSDNDIVELKPSSDVSPYSSVCTVWGIMADNQEKKLCYGSAACCNLVNIPASEGVWDTTLYLSEAYEWVGETNLITVYILGSEGDIIPGQLRNIRSSETQRLEVTLPNSAMGVGGTAQLIQPEKELAGVYMELPEEPEGYNEGSQAVDVQLGQVNQGEIKESEPVRWYQDITLTNTGQQEELYTMSLWSHATTIGIDFLSEVSSFKISLDGEVISESSVALLSLLPGQQQKLEIVYETAPVTIERSCRDITLRELLPPEATLTASELPLDTPIKTVCNVRVFHDTVTHYHNIRVSLPGIDTSSVESVYFVEGDTYLPLVDGAIIVPES